MLFVTLPRQNSQQMRNNAATNYRHIEMKTIVRNGKTYIQKLMEFPNVKIVIEIEEVDNSDNFIASIAIIPNGVIRNNTTANVYHFKYIVDRKEMAEIMQMTSAEQVIAYMKSKSTHSSQITKRKTKRTTKRITKQPTKRHKSKTHRRTTK